VPHVSAAYFIGALVDIAVRVVELVEGDLKAPVLAEGEVRIDADVRDAVGDVLVVGVGAGVAYADLEVARLGKLADAERIAHDLLQLFETPLQLPDLDLAITVSIGVAIFPEDGHNAETLYKRSDEALYKVKRNGRNRVELAGTSGATA
jgi:GGDEF domain-containing protein